MKIFSLNQKIFLPCAVGITGSTTLMAQTLYMREFISAFYGNELAIGIQLGAWLLWTALGSAVMPRIFSSIPTLRRFSILQFLLAFFFPLTLLAIRASKLLFHISPGEIPGFSEMANVAFLTLCPLCIVSGFSYTTACQLFSELKNHSPKTIGQVYVLEAIGAGLGGFVATLFFFPCFSSIQIVLLLSLMNVLSGFGLWILASRRLYPIPAMILGIVGWLLLFQFSTSIEKTWDQWSWKDLKLLATKHTAYGNLAIVQTGEQITVFENGLPLFTRPDPMTVESIVHYALLEHPNPQKILLVGGALSGAIEQAFLHQTVHTVHAVELDPEAIRFIQKYIKPLDWPSDQVQIHFGDARKFIRKTQETFDVILLNIPTPYTAQLNRFYTLEFYQDIRKRLTPRGIFFFQVPSSENAIGKELSEFLSTLYTTLHQVFEEVVVLPGDHCRFIASTEIGQLTTEPYLLIKRIHERQLPTQYVQDYYIEFDLSQERQAYLRSQISLLGPEQINRDFKPMAYLYDALLWTTHHASFMKKIFVFLSNKTFAEFFLFFIGIMGLYYGVSKTMQSPYPEIQLSVGMVGLTEISIELIWILLYQIAFGTAYKTLALLVAAYMAGLALGSRWALHWSSEDSKILFRLIEIQCTIGVYLVSMLGFLRIIHFHQMNWVLFPLGIGLGGFLGGVQFILANGYFLQKIPSVARATGTLYSLDLIGAMFGTLCTTIVILPVLGIPHTLSLLAILNFVAFLILVAYAYLQKTHRCSMGK